MPLQCFLSSNNIKHRLWLYCITVPYMQRLDFFSERIVRVWIELNSCYHRETEGCAAWVELSSDSFVRSFSHGWTEWKETISDMHEFPTCLIEWNTSQSHLGRLFLSHPLLCSLTTFNKSIASFIVLIWSLNLTRNYILVLHILAGALPRISENGRCSAQLAYHFHTLPNNNWEAIDKKMRSFEGAGTFSFTCLF